MRGGLDTKRERDDRFEEVKKERFKSGRRRIGGERK